MSNDLSGQTIRGYEMKEQLGAGGFGAVYLAHQPLLKRDVAIKVILPQFASEPDFIRRFEVEAELIARLEHPFIVPLYDYWRDPSGAYLVMRLVRGGSLRELNEERELTPPEIAGILDQVAAALNVAHRENVVHRDIKPDNILIDKDMNAYLSDFGIAKVAGNMPEEVDEEEGLTGSIHYIPPEQIRGADVSPRTDIYALGVMLYELLAGEHPYLEYTTTQIVLKHLHEDLPDIGEHHVDLADFDAVIQRATAKDPEDRYQTALEMAADFRAYADGGGAGLVEIGNFMPEDVELPNPYKGLRAFQESDSEKFYGRQALIEQLLDELSPEQAYHRFLAVVGPSGSGKSSVVKAGLIPALREGKLSGSEDWFIAETVPGTNPFEEMANSLLRVAVHPVNNLAQKLQQENGLHDMLMQLLPEDSQLLLLLDQFEELFTLIRDVSVRQRYLHNIVHAIQHPESRLRVIATLRADFYDRPLQFREFGEILRQRMVTVLPLGTEELAESIQKPAEYVGAYYEDGLVDTIIRDVGEQPGVLPLLQYALTELFERRQGYMLNLAAYREIGGVTGALARQADELYSGLNPEGQETVRQLFLRLVNVGDGADNTRRRVRRSELPDTRMMDHVIDSYGKSRLLTFDRDPQTREGTIEVAHEAIIRTWQRVRDWIDESREVLQIQRRLTAASQEWQSVDEDPAYLAEGIRLTQFESLLDSDAVLNRVEFNFLEQSIAQRNEKRRIEQARKDHEYQLQKQAANRLRYIAGIMVVFAIVASILSVFAVNGQMEAERNAEAAVAAQATAERREELSSARALAGRLEDIAENNPFIAYALAEDLIVNVKDPERIVDSSALGMLIDNGMVQRIQLAEPARSVAFTADDAHVVVGTVAGTLSLWNINSGENVLEYDSVAGEVISIVPVPGTDEFITIDQTPDYARTMLRWSVEHKAPLGEALPGQQQISALAFNGDGSLAVTGNGGGWVNVIDTATNEVLHQLQTNDGTILSMALSADGRYAAAGGSDNVLAIMDVADGRLMHRLTMHNNLVFDVEFTPDGQHVVSSSTDTQVLMFDTVSGELVAMLANGRDAVFDSVISPDGQYVLSVGQDEMLTIDRMPPVASRVLSGHRDAIFGVDITSDGSRAVTASIDRTLVIWALDVRERLDRFPLDVETSRGIQYSEDGETIFVNINDAEVVRWQPETNDIVQRYTRDDVDSILGMSLIPGRDEFIVGSEDGLMMRFDVESGEILQTYDAHEGRVWEPSALADGQRFVSGSMDTRTILWDIDSGEILQEYSGMHTDEVITADASPDMRFVATASADATVGIWDTESGDLLHRLEGHTRAVIGVGFSPDSSRMLSYALDGSLLLWDTTEWEVIRSLDGHDQATLRAIFLPDARFAVSVSWDETAILWDINTGEAIRQFEGAGSMIRNASLSPDGQYLAAATEQGPVIIWWVMPDENKVLDWAQAVLPMPELNCEDREIYQSPSDCEVSGDDENH